MNEQLVIDSGVEIAMSVKGGRLLRQLREQMQQTQLWVELEADLGSGYLQRVESGKVKKPLRDTLERILDALHARYSERQYILELYGYTVSIPQPDASEIAWAIDVSQSELDAGLFPAYVLDCRHELIAWNQQAVRLLTDSPDAAKMQTLNRKSMLRAWFDEQYTIAARVKNPDEFFPAMLRAFRHEAFLYDGEFWHQRLKENLLSSCPLMREYWENTQHTTFPNAGRSVVPLHICGDENTALQFRLSAEHFSRDTRFRIIYFFPADIITMQQCTLWASKAHSSSSKSSSS